MAEKHAVVRTDLMHGTDVRAELMSIKYMGADGETATAIDNGNIVKVNDLMEGEREIFVGTTPAADDELGDLALVAGVEMMYDERLRNLDDYFNEAGKTFRGYRLHPGAIFSVTKDALSGTPEVGQVVALAADTKLEVGGAGTVVGKIIEEEVLSRYTYYAIKVNPNAVATVAEEDPEAGKA